MYEDFEIEESAEGFSVKGEIDMGEMISVTLPREMWNEVIRILVRKNSAMKKEIKFKENATGVGAISLAELWEFRIELLILGGAEYEIIRQTLPSEREKDAQCAPIQEEEGDLDGDHYGDDFRPECEFMPDKCAECWKRWLLTEREGETDD